MRIFGILLLVFLIQGTTYARDLKIKLGIDTGIHFSDSFINKFDSRWSGQGNVSAEIESFKNFFVGLGFSRSVIKGTVFNDIDLNYTKHEFLAEVSYRYPLKTWLQPYGKIRGGFVWHKFKMMTLSQYSTEDYGFSIEPLIGIDFIFHIPAISDSYNPGLFKKYAMGFYIESGYSYVKPMDLSHINTEYAEKNDEKITTHSFGLNDLDVSGILVNFGANFLF